MYPIGALVLDGFLQRGEKVLGFETDLLDLCRGPEMCENVLLQRLFAIGDLQIVLDILLYSASFV